MRYINPRFTYLLTYLLNESENESCAEKNKHYFAVQSGFGAQNCVREVTALHSAHWC